MTKKEINSNDIKYKNYIMNQIYIILIIIFSLLVIFLEALSLFGKISMYWGFIPFVILSIIKLTYSDFKIKSNKRKK